MDLRYNGTMKKFIVLLSLIALPLSARADENPMFCDGCINSVALFASQGTGSGTLFKLVDPILWEFQSMTNFNFQYSQPMEIFRLPSRINFNLVQNFGYEHDRGLSFFAIGVSWDIALLSWNGFYLGFGVGPYMRDSRDRYVDSRLVFGERFFIGKDVSDRWRIEWFTQHFSNGNFTDTNLGFNFTGFAVNFSF